MNYAFRSTLQYLYVVDVFQIYQLEVGLCVIWLTMKAVQALPSFTLILVRILKMHHDQHHHIRVRSTI